MSAENIKENNINNDLNEQNPKIPMIAKVILFLIPFFMLMGAEILCILFFNEPKPMGEIIKILRQDKELFWIQKPNLNIPFQGTQVTTDSFGLRTCKKNEKRDSKILCLGASPTFGWGVDAKYAYPAVIEQKLKEMLSDKKYSVINCGCIGFTSHQGVILTKKLLKKFKPDFVTISYLVNEVDKYRFFRNYPVPDNKVPSMSQSRVSFENLINKSMFYRFFRHSVLKLLGKPGFSKKIYNSYNRTRRVSPDEYAKNISEIVKLVKQAGAKPILIKTHVRFPDKNERIICENFDSRKEISEELADIISLAEEKNFKKSLEKLNILCAKKPWLPELQYLKGLVSNNLNFVENSKKAFKKAQVNELAECSYLSRSYENKMVEISTSKNIPMLDITKKFRSFGSDYGKILYVNPEYDFVHPNIKGHGIIGQAVADLINKTISLGK